MNSQTLTASHTLSAHRGVGSHYLLSAAAAISGGLMIVAGSMMPWMTLFAGLHTYSGLIGMNGRMLMAGGVISIIIGLALTLRGGRTLNRAAGGLGVVLLAFTAWLLTRQYEMYQELITGHPMTVPGIGPGLYVAAAGALIITLTLLTWRVKTSGPR